ncbi:hypothetical protein V1226_11205 [Lachnospiraceae bacterium JLR.KK009]|jgi:hypothetical protein
MIEWKGRWRIALLFHSLSFMGQPYNYWENILFLPQGWQSP